MRKKIGQVIKRHTTFHNSDGSKNIFLFSSPRSGSTWLMQLIGTQPGFKLVREPFDIRQAVVRDNLKINDFEELYSAQALPKIEAYTQKFINDKDRDYRFKRERLLGDTWHMFTNRIIFKVLHACEDQISWFEETFNGDIIFLIRHPIPVSISRKKLPRLQSFITSDYRRHFTDEQINYAKKIIDKGSHFEKAVVDWCFQNAVPLRNRKENWQVFSYEQTVLFPEIVINNLLHKFQFEQPDLMYKRLIKASGSTIQSNAETQKILNDPEKISQNKQWLVEKWKDKVSDAQQEKTFEILDVFGIDFYTIDRTLPQEKYLLHNPGENQLA